MISATKALSFSVLALFCLLAYGTGAAQDTADPAQIRLDEGAAGAQGAPAAEAPEREADSAAGLPAPDADRPFPRDVVLVLDNSGSMKKNDPRFLTGAAVTGFIERLDDLARVAMIAFDQDVRMTVPMTALTGESRARILENLNKLNYGGLFTDSPAAVERAIYELKNNGRPDAQKLIIFMTDGIVDTGNPAVDLEKTKWLREDLAPDASEAGIRIFGIAFTDSADFQLIQSVAQNTDGEYFRALSAEDLPRVFEKISSVIDRLPEAEPEPPPVTVVQEPPAAAPAPVIIEVPVPAAASVNEEERVRALIIIVAAVILVAALVAIIVLLLRRSRDFRAVDEQYVAEAYLNDIHGITGQTSYQLGSKPTMLGRVAGKDTDHLDYLVVPQSTIGRRHALIEYKDFGYWIMDQGSINGTFVNDRPVSSEVRLKHGDRVRVHKCEFEFVMPEMSEAGMTVVSQTRFSGQRVESGEEATVLKAGAQARADEEMVIDITNAAGDARGAAPDEEETVMRAGSARQPARDDNGSDDETLLPAQDERGGGGRPADSEEDETLMPGGSTVEPEAPESEDETLLPGGAADVTPGAGRPARDKGDDDFFDVSGLGPRRK